MHRAPWQSRNPMIVALMVAVLVGTPLGAMATPTALSIPALHSPIPSLSAQAAHSAIAPQVYSDYPVAISDIALGNATAFSAERNLVRTDDDTIHVVWSGNESDAAGAWEIWYSNSDDEGLTWSTAVNLSNDVGGAAPYSSITPAIATNGSDIFVVWHDDTLNAGFGGPAEHLSFRSSDDNGVTWVPDLSVAPRRVYTDPDEPEEPTIWSNATNLVVLAENLENGGGNDDIVNRWYSGNGGTSWVGGGTDLGNDVIGDSRDDYYSPAIGGNDSSILAVYEYDNEGVQPFPPFNAWLRETYEKDSTDNGVSFPPVPVGLGDQLPGAMISGEPDTNSYNPSFGMDGDYRTVAWVEQAGGSWQLHVRWTSDGGVSWFPDTADPPMTIGDARHNQTSPTVSQVGPIGYVLYVSDNTSAAGDLVLLQTDLDTNTSQAPFFVTDDANGDSYPSLNYDNTADLLEWVWSRDDGAGAWSVVYAQITSEDYPTLTYVGDSPAYTGSGLDRLVGYTAETYTFRVLYTSPGDVAPDGGSVTLLVDWNQDGDFLDPAERTPMDEEDVADTDFTDGKVYSYDTTYPGVGTDYLYDFEASAETFFVASGEATVTVDAPDIIGINGPPQLTWVGDGGYATDGVEPDEGATATDFVFKARYQDDQGDAPDVGYPLLRLDLDGNGAFDDLADAALQMDETVISDTDVSDGKVYAATYRIGVLGLSYGYRMEANDSIGLPAKPINASGPLVVADTTAPTLEPSDDPFLVGSTVTPSSGATGTLFTFGVVYADADGDAPDAAGVELWVDRDLDSVADATEWMMMDSTTDTYDSGVLFLWTITLPSVGNYTHGFRARDLNGAPATGSVAWPTTLAGPIIDTVNAAPWLDWVGLAGLESDGVDPDSGMTNLTPFAFSVRYTDADGDAPVGGAPQLWVDLDRDFEMDADEVELTSPLADSTDYVAGVDFGSSMTFTQLGTYGYQFSATDARGLPAGGLPNLYTFGPVVDAIGNLDAPPVLSDVGVAPYLGAGVAPISGTTATSFTYKVLYADAEGETPGGVWVWIDRDGDGDSASADERLQLAVDPGQGTLDYSTGVVYSVATTFAAANVDHSYAFSANDSAGTPAVGPATALRVGPFITSVNTPPRLAFGSGTLSDGFDPQSGSTDTVFTFSVTYTDAEGDAPAAGTPLVLLGPSDDLTPEDAPVVLVLRPTDEGAYLSGRGYSASTTLALGTYKIRYWATDLQGEAAVGAPTLVSDGPVVDNRAPRLVPLHAGSSGDVGTVIPLDGNTSVTFAFEVLFWDDDGDEPAAAPTVEVLDRTGTVIATLSMVSTGTNFSTDAGRPYRATTAGLAIGTYFHRFHATDTHGAEAAVLEGAGPSVRAPVTPGPDNHGGLNQTTNEVLPWWVFPALAVLAGCIIVGLVVGRRSGRDAGRREALEASEPLSRSGTGPPGAAGAGPSVPITADPQPSARQQPPDEQDEPWPEEPRRPPTQPPSGGGGSEAFSELSGEAAVAGSGSVLLRAEADDHWGAEASPGGAESAPSAGFAAPAAPLAFVAPVAPPPIGDETKVAEGWHSEGEIDSEPEPRATNQAEREIDDLLKEI